MSGYQPHTARSRQTMAKLKAILRMLTAIVLFTDCNGYAQLQQDFPVTNSSVTAILQDSSTMYIGGWFDYAGPNTGNGVVLDTLTGKYDPSFPKVNGTVYASVSDGKGGWYIGGEFSKVGKVYRNSLAHILSDGSVDDWNPNVRMTLYGVLIKGSVRSIAINDSTVYFGGIFDHVGEAVRNLAAAVNINTGLPTAWDPDVDGIVRTIIATPTTIYLGGNFNTLQASSQGKINRSGLASVNTSTGYPTSWNPGVDFGSTNYGVSCLLLSDSTLYVGGNFTSLAGTNRNGIGAVNTITGSITPWNPNGGNSWRIQVSALELSGNVMYIGGAFSKMGSRPRINLAAANSIGNGTVLPWNPGVSFVKLGVLLHTLSNLFVPGVYSIAASGATVYVGGLFNRAGETVRRNLAAFDTSGVLTAWNPGASLTVSVLKKSGAILYAGGEFTSVNGFTRNKLAAIDLETKTVNSWDPNADEPVEALALYDSKIFVGGYFNNIGAQNTAILAAVDKKTGVVDPWTLNTVSAGGIGEIAIYKDRLYAGGWFSAFGDSVRSGIVAIDLLSGKVLPWYPGEMRSPYSILPTDSLIYTGGNYGLYSVSTKTGEFSSWDPFHSTQEAGLPKKLLLKDKTLYVAGTHLPADITGVSKTSILKIDLATGAILPFDPKLEDNYYDLTANDIAIADSTLYAVGFFSTVGGVPRKNIAALDISTGSLKPWNPKLETQASVVFVDPSRKTVYMGGEFHTVDDDPASFLAAYSDTSLGTLTSVEESPEQQPRSFSLNQNYPNPFNPTTTISYSIPTNNFVTLKVFNILGQEVASLVNENLAAGKYTVTFNAGNLTSGVYLYQVEAGSFRSVKKMLLIK
ncbi:MAG: T9SS type A sorting domain-containing protein [Ignavibacteriaceae bacterium]